jgi:hypothetical protein
MNFRGQRLLALLTILFMPASVYAQPPVEPAVSGGQHDHMQMDMSGNNTWQLMQDGIVFGEFNHQGGPRGGNEFVVPNWWMGMASRKTSRGQLTLTSMLSLDPASVGKDGYREIFQAGEALNGRPLIDRQHPHDLFMQLGAVWRIPVLNPPGLRWPAARPGNLRLDRSPSCTALPPRTTRRPRSVTIPSIPRTSRLVS